MPPAWHAAAGVAQRRTNRMPDEPVSADPRPCVVHVSDWGRSNAFYRTCWVRRSSASARASPTAGTAAQPPRAGPSPDPVAPARAARRQRPVLRVGGRSRRGAHLERRGVAVELGPVARFGAKGRGRSVYFRDPDGSLLEFTFLRGGLTREGPGSSTRPPAQRRKKRQRLLNWKLRRALALPYFLRSTSRSSRVRKPPDLSSGRKRRVVGDERAAEAVADGTGLAGGRRRRPCT